MSQATRLNDLLKLRRAPVAVKYQASAPARIPRIDAAAASGCTYWKLAAEGRTFYTEAADHYGCPVGSYTHGIDLPEEKAKELDGLVGTMVELQYIAMEEVPGIPQLEGEFGVAIYAPLAEADFEPDAVLVSGNARQMMLLAEAAHAAGVASDTSMVGRPTCAAIPVVMRSGRTATNLGCIGNRVYTELADDELYFVIAGGKLADVVERLETIVKANTELEAFHRQRESAWTRALYYQPCSATLRGTLAWGGGLMKPSCAFAALAITLAAASTVNGQIKRGVMTVTGAEMHWWAGVARDATARLYDVDHDSVVFKKLEQRARYDQGTVTFRARKGKLIDLDKLHESIWATRLSGGTRSGLVSLQVTAIGSVVASGDRIVLKVANSDAEFVLLRHPEAEHAAAYDGLQSVSDGGTVALTGVIDNYRGRWPDVLRTKPDKPRRILVTGVKMLPAAEGK